ncbi:DUF1501 domain-containing protein [Pirellulales bacterium]|nr:DUF1501 domain-containing protein [Pirellulales bacterium]
MRPMNVCGRRAFLVASGSGFAGLHFAGAHRLVAADDASEVPEVTGGGKAKSVILFFLCGGASHVDTWDMKPHAPAEYRGVFSPIQTSAPDIRLCEHLPLLAKQAHHLAVINSVDGTVNTNDHHAGYYYNLTGHVPDPTFLSLGNDRRPYIDDWPFMGSVVGSRRPSKTSLPNALTLPHKPSKAPYTRPGQFAARLGVEFDPLYIHGSNDKPLKFQAPSLVLSGDVTADQLRSRQKLLKTLDVARQQFEQYPAERTWKQHQRRALDLLLSSDTTRVFDVASESDSTRSRYGQNVNGMSLLLARRMVEAEVPFVTVFWKENEAISNQCKSAGGWDTHGNNFNCLKDHLLPEFDQAFSALIEDLDQRNLLDQTLLVVNSEMGRTPKIGDPRSGGASGAGRDHWTHCLSVLMAGGGIQGGQTYGASDRFGEYPADYPLTPADITKTVYYAAGVDNLQAKDSQGRPYNLLEEGRAITQLF